MMSPTQPEPLSPAMPSEALPIEDNLDRQERIWRFERVGWGVLWLSMAAGLAGVFGGGPLSHAFVGTAQQPLQLEYQRFAQFQTPLSLKLHIAPAPKSDRPTPLKTVKVWLDRDYLENWELHEITPTPLRTEAGRDRLTFTFALSDPGQPTAITFNLEAEQMGWLQGQVGLTGEPPLKFRQLIYP